MNNDDLQIRLAAMQQLDRFREKNGEIISFKILKTGFLFKGKKIHYLSPQGIFKPKYSKYPLTITSVYDGPYNDSIDNDFLSYKYRGFDKSYINHVDNVGLRKCMEKQLPLIYLHGVEKGQYVPIYPVYIVGDNPDLLEFKAVVDELKSLNTDRVEDFDFESGRRRYITRSTKIRLHQSGFRARIMKAYKETCAFCKLKHVRLLDAAHIVPDSDEGANEIQNGMALCKIHHSAYDLNVIGVDPDYIIHVRKDILEEIDGPMLKYGIQELHQNKIFTPRGNKKPKKEYLDYRYARFLSA